MLAPAALSAFIVLAAGGCGRKAGVEGGFEYTAGVWAAEMTGVRSAGDAESAPERLVVPSRLGGKRVRSVAAGAFRGTDAVSVKVPWRVSAIGAGAFAGCTNLLWAELPSRLERVEEGLFRGCTRMEESDVPERVETIGACAYGGCSRLKRVGLPENLRSIGERAFSMCPMLESVELPDGITSIPDGAFEGCSGLKTVKIPVGVTNIGARAFAGCVALEAVELPEGLRTVGEEAFARCGRLESVSLPASAERLGGRAFAGCTGLRSLEVAPGNPVYSSRDGVLFRDGGTGLAVYPCGREGAYVVPSGVRSVGDDAFAQCGGVESVFLPASVERLGERTFAECPGLRSVEVEVGHPVFAVRDGVLFRDGGKELVLFPGGRGGAYAVPEGVERIAPGAFRGGRVETVEIPGGVGMVGADAFRDCRELRQVALGEGVRELGDGAFAGCRSLWGFEMPDSVGTAGGGLFAGCDGLRLLVYPDALGRDPPPRDAWQVPDGCLALSRSGWEEERTGKCPGRAVAPFYGRYADEKPETVVFEGTVLATSALPDPGKNDYDDCLYAILVELDSVLSTTPASTNLERVVLVNVPVMEDRTLVREHVFEPDDKVRCTCAAYDAMPQGILEIQLSDDIQSFEHRQYYPLRIERIPAFRETGNKDFAKREITILPVRRLPRDAAAAAARRARMQGEIARIERELALHGGSFEAWKEEYKPVAERYARLCEEKRAGWIGDSYFAAGGPESRYNTKAYIEGLLPYKKYLEENNIDLIVARVPSRWDFAARVLAADGFRENPAWVEHQYECLKNGIEIVDPMPAMWKKRFDFPLFYFYRDPDERHPGEGTAFVLAEEIAGVLARYPYPKAEPEITLQDVRFETDWDLFFWPAGNGKYDPSDNLVFKQAVQDGEPCDRFALRSGSPFLFLSNSYFWFPQRPLGASVPGYTAFLLQTVPDWRYRGGVNNQLVSYLLEPHVLDFRRAVVMAGGFDAWRGFPAIPEYIPDGARRISLEKTIPAASDEITLRTHGSFACSNAPDGSVWIESGAARPEKRADHFDMGFPVPRIEGKRTAMVRVNIERAQALTVVLEEDGSGTELGSVRVLPGWLEAADFFFTPGKPSTDVTLRFFPSHPEKGVGIADIELWYY